MDGRSVMTYSGVLLLLELVRGVAIVLCPMLLTTME
jgi:hypothetical protein